MIKNTLKFLFLPRLYNIDVVKKQSPFHDVAHEIIEITNFDCVKKINIISMMTSALVLLLLSVIHEYFGILFILYMVSFWQRISYVETYYSENEKLIYEYIAFGKIRETLTWDINSVIFYFPKKNKFQLFFALNSESDNFEENHLNFRSIKRYSEKRVLGRLGEANLLVVVEETI